TMISICAVRPCLRELRRDRALPAWLRGPVLCVAFARLACSCLFDVITGTTFKLLGLPLSCSIPDLGSVFCSFNSCSRLSISLHLRDTKSAPGYQELQLEYCTSNSCIRVFGEEFAKRTQLLQCRISLSLSRGSRVFRVHHHTARRL